MNRVTLIGNLGSNPDLKYVGDQKTAICGFSLATNERRTGNNGQVEEHVEWHTVKVFGKAAENAAKYLAKGRQVCVEGKIHTEKWEKDGQKHSVIRIYATNVEYLGGTGNGGGQQQARQQPQQQAPQQQQGAPDYGLPPDTADGEVPF